MATLPNSSSPALTPAARRGNNNTVTGRRADTAAFVASLGQRRVQVEMGEDGTVYVSNIRPAEVDDVLVEDKGLAD